MSSNNNNVFEHPRSQKFWEEDTILPDAPSFWECNPPKTFAELDTAINTIPTHDSDDEKRRLHTAYTKNLAYNLFRNVELASYAHEKPTDEVAVAKFSKFPKLPPGKTMPP